VCVGSTYTCNNGRNRLLTSRTGKEQRAARAKSATANSRQMSDWSLGNYGLEVQEPWARLILDGKKTIETRGYALPEALWNQKIWILEAKVGERGPGCSSVDDVIHLQNNTNDIITCIGWCVFDRIFRYNTRLQFESDLDQHLVPSTCKFAFNEHKDVYGWVVSSCGYLENNNEEPWDVAIRRMRSLFLLKRGDL
jgi:hypothetical protein